MELRKEMEQDDSFYINPVTMDSLFKYHNIYSYEWASVALGKIRKYEHKKKKIWSLCETDTYRYLENPESEKNRDAYKTYCEQKENLKDNPDRSEKVFRELMLRLGEEEYDPKKGVIVINQYNCIVDGFHRSCILLKKYGEDHKINVLRIRCDCAKWFLLLNPLYEVKMAVKMAWRKCKKM